MLRSFTAGAAAFVLCAILGAGSAKVAANNAEDLPGIEEIMKKVNSKKSGIHPALDPLLKADPVKWDDVSKMTKEYETLAVALGKNKPDKGSAVSWAKLCKGYADEAKSLNAAAGKKDKAAATAAYAKLSKSCQACHDEHRE
jgi:hypothetical protein